MSTNTDTSAVPTMTDQKVLIIDAHPVYSYKIQGFLQGLTFQRVHLCHSAQEGLRFAEAEKPALVILSGMLPDQESHQVCKILKEICPTLKIIVQIGLFTDTPVIERFKAMGADSVLARKEKDLMPLQSKIEELLA